MRYPLLLVLALLAGCSALPGRHGADEDGAGEGAARVAPNAELTGPLLYDLLVGELAAHRGQFALSTEKFLTTARSVRDPRLAQKGLRVALYAHDHETALDAAKLWVDLAPKESQAHQSVAALLIMEGKLSEARPSLERVIGLAPEGAEGFSLVTTLLAQSKDKQAALDLFDSLLQSRRNDPNAIYAYGHLAYLFEGYPLALEQADKALELKPEWGKALVLRANALRRLARNDEAADTFKRAVEKEPGESSVRLSYARFLVDERRLPEAREQFHTLNQQKPDMVEVVYALGLLALQAGDVDEAEGHFLQLVNSDQLEAESAYALGQIAENRRRWDEAIKWYEVVRHGSPWFDARLRTAMVLAQKDGPEVARNYLRSLHTQSDEQRIKIWLAEGETLRNRQQFAEAKGVYDQALAQFPGSGELLYARAMVAERLDQIDLLESDLRAILKEDPDNIQALNALGYTLADRTQRYQEAYELINRAYQKSPDDPAIMDSMGWILFRLGRTEEAIAHLRKAAALFNDAEIAAHLGEVLWVSGQRDEARQVWDAAVKRSPDDEHLRQAIERLTR